jgi:hypothetical protein
MTDLAMGIYRHYKGPLYQVLGLAHDANEDGRTCVVYIGLQLDAAHLGPRLAVRTVSDFAAYLDPDTGESRPGPLSGLEQRAMWREGWRPRFQYLGAELTAEMLP